MFGFSKSGVRASVGHVLVGLVFLGLTSSSATASLIVSVQPSTVNAAPGSTGNVLTIQLQNTAAAPTGPFSLAGFNVTLSAPAGSGITFTGGDETVPSYLFAGNSFGFLFGNPGGSNNADISDFSLGAGGQTVAANSTTNLGRVFYSVASGASPANVPITITAASSFTDNSTFNPIPYASVNGQVTVAAPGDAAAVPEPASLVLWGLLGAGIARAARSRRFLGSRSSL